MIITHINSWLKKPVNIFRTLPRDEVLVYVTHVFEDEPSFMLYDPSNWSIRDWRVFNAIMATIVDDINEMKINGQTGGKVSHESHKLV